MATNLPRIKQPLRIDDLLNPLHELDRARAELVIEVCLFPDPDAVFACACE